MASDSVPGGQPPAKSAVSLLRRRTLGWTVRGLLGVGLIKAYWNTRPSEIELTFNEVPIPNLPAAFDGMRIVQLTDLHASWQVGAGHFARAAELVMSVAPDLIVFTGDFVTGATKFGTGSTGGFDIGYLAESMAAMSGLAARHGIFGVLGNHDFWCGPEAVASITAAYAKGLGLRMLRNEAVRIERGGAGIDLLGIDDYWEDSCSLQDACRGLARDGVRVLLSHNPDINEEIELMRTRIDLVISGHTHGGQVVLPLAGQPVMPSKFGQKYRVGLVRDGARHTFVSRGVGHLVAPVRLNCPPEVALIVLRRA